MRRTFSPIGLPPCPTLFPYTTLFRSRLVEPGLLAGLEAPWLDDQRTSLEDLRIRSEEHTSELQSLRHLVCRLLLEKKRHLLGRKKEARELFERLLDVRNDLGLLSEEYDPRAKRQLGNFPQAFSHVALVGCARILGDEDLMFVRDD